MNTIVEDPAQVTGQQELEQLLSQLSHYRRQSERLEKINDLYHRMAGALDLATMIETYSIWLAEHVDHELIGYHNPDQGRMHLFCSSHGAERRHIIQLAETVLRQPPPKTAVSRQLDGYHAAIWPFVAENTTWLLLLLRRDTPIDDTGLELINESLEILAGPLRRAMDYERIFEQARKDALTGLPNRTVFEERLPCFMERASRHGHPLTLAALDLDHFKAINDTLGHLMGDEVLKQVTAALQAQIRMTDLLVRMGGDEFLLVLPDTDMAAARHLAERLCRAVDALDIRCNGDKLGISIGLAQWQPGMSRDQWLEQADDLLYQAKKNGRAQVAVH